MKAKPGTKLGFIALGLAVALAFGWFRVNQVVGIPEDRTLFVVSWVAAVLFGIAAFVRGTRWFGGIAAVVAIVIGVFLPFTISISKQGLGAEAIQVGDVLPQFEAIDEFGETFNSESLQGQLVLIKFFRAHW